MRKFDGFFFGWWCTQPPTHTHTRPSSTKKMYWNSSKMFIKSFFIFSTFRLQSYIQTYHTTPIHHAHDSYKHLYEHMKPGVRRRRRKKKMINCLFPQSVMILFRKVSEQKKSFLLVRRIAVSMEVKTRRKRVSLWSKIV